VREEIEGCEKVSCSHTGICWLIPGQTVGMRLGTIEQLDETKRSYTAQRMEMPELDLF